MVLKRLLKDRRGVISAEMALIMPGIAYVLLNVVDLSMYIYTRMQLDLAAHEAVGAARVLCDTAAKLPAKQNCGSTLDATMLAAARTTSLGSTVTLGTSSEAYYCADSSAVLQQVAAYSATPPANCSGTISGSTAVPGDYISVTASRTYTPLFPGASIAAMLPTTMTRTAWMRLK